MGRIIVEREGRIGWEQYGSLIRKLGTIMIERFETWSQRRRQRTALLEMSDAMLKDIGITRAEAIREASRPFWR